jgi:hypothetical protein
MRRWMMAAMVAAVLGGAAAEAPSASAAGTPSSISRDAALLHTAQYYGERRYGADWGLRHGWREHRRAEEEARIAEATRREAWRIEREREHRREWRLTQREQHGYGPAYRYGHHRAW